MSKKKHELIEMPVSYGENYTELVHEGEGIKIDKGVISASGGSGGGVFTTERVYVMPISPPGGPEPMPYYELSNTWQEIFDACADGRLAFAISKPDELNIRYSINLILRVAQESDYRVYVERMDFDTSSISFDIFSCTNTTDKPILYLS